jgi:hypothetical protein
LEAALEGAFRKPGEPHERAHRVLLQVVFGDPGLAARDESILDLPGAGKAREGP